MGAARSDAEAGDHLVEHQNGAVFRAGFAGGFQVEGGGEDRALVAHGGFHDDHGNVALRQAVLQGFRVVPGQHGDVGGGVGELAAAAGDRGGGAGRGRGGPEDVVEPAVVVALEFQHDAAICCGSGDPKSRLDGLGAGGAEAHPFGAGDHFADQAGGFGFEAGLAAVEDAAVELRADGGDHVGRGVAEDHRAHGEVIVDQAVAVGVGQDGAFAAFQDEGGGGDAEAEIRGDAAGEVFRGLGDAAAGFVEGEFVVRQGVAAVAGGGHGGDSRWALRRGSRWGEVVSRRGISS